ncbi:hypothetical protein C8R46DRAFT_1024290 [Mycena filopes]|nr:hypothetical protein C8R46DRAFT_1024290 [Mycena filopes]
MSTSSPGPDLAAGLHATQEQASTLLASAQSYLPSLASAKAYLPEGVAAYLPSSASESSLPAATPSAASTVDVGHATSVPYTESAPEPYAATNTSTSTSTSNNPVDVGHSTSIPYTASAPEPYSANNSTTSLPRQDTTGTFASTTAQTGHSTATSPSSAFPAPPSFPTTMKNSVDVDVGTPPHPAAPPSFPSTMKNSVDVDVGTPPPAPLSTHESTDLVAADKPLPTPPSSGAVVDSAHEVNTRPSPTPGLLPSHPAAGPDAAVHAYPTPGANDGPVHALPTHNVHAVHPTPHAVPSSSCAVNTTSTDPSSSASGVTESLRTPPDVPAISAPASTFPPFVGDLGLGGREDFERDTGLGSAALNSGRREDTAPSGTHVGAGGDNFVGGVGLGSAALNSARREDLVPSGTDSPPVGADADGSFVRDTSLGSAALNSTRHEDNVPTGTDSSSVDADEGGDSGSADDDAGDDGGKEGGKGKGKKRKLLARLKEKMHSGVFPELIEFGSRWDLVQTFLVDEKTSFSNAGANPSFEYSDLARSLTGRSGLSADSALQLDLVGVEPRLPAYLKTERAVLVRLDLRKHTMARVNRTKKQFLASSDTGIGRGKSFPFLKFSVDEGFPSKGGLLANHNGWLIIAGKGVVGGAFAG